MEPKEWLAIAIDLGTRFGVRIVGAIALWIVGRTVINFCGRLVNRGLVNQHIDPTLGRYVASTATIALNVVLIIAILGIFGVETTTFAAVIAAAGVAIGIAWGGMLGNFAAGVFLVIFRPFKTGDFVSAGGVTGTVHEIGMFASSMDTPDNVRTIVGNNKIVSDTIQNFSANPYRRVDLTATINNAVDHREAIRILKSRLSTIPNVLATPEPEVDILQFTPAGPLLCVRPCCANAHYSQVYFDTNRLIRESFDEAKFPAPVPAYSVSGPMPGPAWDGPRH